MDLNFHKVKDIILTKDQYSEKGCNWVDVSIITDKGEEMNLNSSSTDCISDIGSLEILWH